MHHLALYAPCGLVPALSRPLYRHTHVLYLLIPHSPFFQQGKVGGSVRIISGIISKIKSSTSGSKEKEEGEMAQAKERARIHHLDPPGCFSTALLPSNSSRHSNASYKGLWCETKINGVITSYLLIKLILNGSKV